MSGTPPTTSSEAPMSSTPTDPGSTPTATAAGLVDPSQYEAPMPTDRTVRQRTNLAVQAYRFAAVSLKMTRMVLRSHG